jgi:23S rRNA A1618 N6-methylase RlmF
MPKLHILEYSGNEIEKLILENAKKIVKNNDKDEKVEKVEREEVRLMFDKRKGIYAKVIVSEVMKVSQKEK